MAMYIEAGKENWIPFSVTTVHRAVPVAPQLAAIPVGGVVIWTPPCPGLVRAFTINDDSGDPLVGSGGATNILVGSNTAAMLVNTVTLATYGTTLCGWGVNGPSVATSIIGTADGGVAVAPAGSIPGRAAVARVLSAFSNAGTITGTLKFRFEFRPQAW